MPVPTLYAHRGATAELPENTLPAFHRALEVGAGALEMDVHLTRDGHVVVSHDATGERMAGISREIRRATLDEVRGWDVGRVSHERARSAAPSAGKITIPTLAEVVEAFPNIPINIDIKQHDRATVNAVVALIHRLGAHERVLLTSFDGRTIARVRALGYRGPTGLGLSEIVRLLALPLSALRRWPLRGRAAQIPTRSGRIPLDRPALIDKAHALGLSVHYWTINDPFEAERLLRLGADGIMTDDPAAIAPVFARFTSS